MMYTTTLNRETERAERYIRQYEKSTCHSVQSFYGRPSYNKIRAEAKIRDRMAMENCVDYRVLGGNSSYFTVGYRRADNKKLYIETYCNIYEIDIHGMEVV